MALFTIADLHLSTASDHPMDIFGARWQNYTEKISKNWRAVVGENDTVIVPGDISWGMTLEEALPDLAFINSLPGKKLLGKGNHDFWWATAAKMTRFFEEHHLDTLSLLYNNATVAENYIVCGTRGWFLEENQQTTVGNVDYEKIVNRELARLKLSLDAAVALQQNGHSEKEILVFFHFPPCWSHFCCREMLELLSSYGIERCYFGHIHGTYEQSPVIDRDGLVLRLISSDFLNFVPHRIP